MDCTIALQQPANIWDNHKANTESIPLRLQKFNPAPWLPKSTEAPADEQQSDTA